MSLQIGPGTVEAGIYSYNALPLAGATVFENLTDVTSYSYDAAKKELVSYDTPHIASLKAQYVQSKGLAGSMFWDVSKARSWRFYPPPSFGSLITSSAPALDG